jgi:hypothetical protein
MGAERTSAYVVGDGGSSQALLIEAAVGKVILRDGGRGRAAA